MSKPLAFVLPRFGAGVVGGAEALVGALAEKLKTSGVKVEILTTCARDNRTWENEFSPGESVEDGIVVRRFPVDDRDLDLWIPLQIRLSEGMGLSLDEELTWMEHSVNSTALYSFLREHVSRYRAFIFAPYLFGTTFWGVHLVPERAVLLPCLHDECYAYTAVVRSEFRNARGIIFNALPEKDLAESLFGGLVGGEVGMGFDEFDSEYVESLARPGATEGRYILYVGRKETGKNVQLLIDYFINGKDSKIIPEDLSLVILGGGSFEDLHRPAALNRGDIVDLSHVPEEIKHGYVRHAIALVQPSRNESFSIVLMEAWLLGTPVIVHGSCPVTREHVLQSGGGLYFGDEREFSSVVQRLSQDDELRGILGDAGRNYVREKYCWDAVLQRFSRVMDTIFSAPSESVISQ